MFSPAMLLNAPRPSIAHSPMCASARAPFSVLLCVVVALPSCRPGGTARDAPRINPHPIALHRPKRQPLSAAAQLGRELFFDPALSASGRMSCGSCHAANAAYGPPDSKAVQLGGLAGDAQGGRAVPSLRYLSRIPNFEIGPDTTGEEPLDMNARAAQAAGAPPAQKKAGARAAPPLVPRGGLFWDGRSNTLQDQARGPLFNPAEMANTDVSAVAARLARAPYAARFTQLFGAQIFSDARRSVDEALFAIARFQFEDESFQPYSSKYDAYLEGKAELTSPEARGLRLFEDPARANCAGCHPSRPGPDGQPPLFTDHQYEALGVPRNEQLLVNRDPAYFDLGLCGPVRGDLQSQRQYCGMFNTPTLRNAARRGVFFHNGVYHSLAEVVEFYNGRDLHPERFYPRGNDGAVLPFNDLPPACRGNVDKLDAPFNRRAGDRPPLDAEEIRELIAFLETLNDGYVASDAPAP